MELLTTTMTSIKEEVVGTDVVPVSFLTLITVARAFAGVTAIFTVSAVVFSG